MIPRQTVRSVLTLSIGVLPWLALMGFHPQESRSLWTEQQWQRWRDSQIRRILEPTFDNGTELVLDRATVVARCNEAFQYLKQNPPSKLKSLENFQRFVDSMHWMDLKESDGKAPHGLAMDIPDSDYWKFVQPVVEFPYLLRSQAFLKSMSSPSGYQTAVKMIDAQNRSLPQDQKWIVQPFRAQFIKSADQQTYGRMLVYVPNEKLSNGKIRDRWIMFALATPDLKPGTEVRSVSFIATVRDPSNPGEHEGYFADFMRDKNRATGDIEINSNFLMKDSPSKNCVDCHKTAVLPIHPMSLYRFDRSGKLVVDPDSKGPFPELNQTVFRLGKSQFTHLEPQAYGPSLGSQMASTPFVIQATSLTLTSAQKVAESSNCASCHNSFAPINSWLALRSDQETKSYEKKIGLVQWAIESGYMPPNNTLTKDERHALWKTVTKQYCDLETGDGDFVQWLKVN